MNTYTNRSNSYEETAVHTASPEQLVVLLYQGAIRFLRQSISAIEAKNIDLKRHAIDRAVAIIQHLQETLDRDRGQHIAAELDKLYNYCTSRILEGSGKLDIRPIEEAIKLLNTLLVGWEGAAAKECDVAVPSVLMTPPSGATGRFQLHV